MKYTVDIIIPVRYRNEYDVCERLRFKKRSIKPEGFNFIVVDYGSEKCKANEIKLCCEELDFTYIYSGEPSKLWNASAARNIGILESKADYLIFEDVDLKHPIDFYEKVDIEISTLLETNDWLFFVIPVTYLSEYCTSVVPDVIDYKFSSFIASEVYKTDSPYIQHHAPASSFLVCKRDVAMSIGGYDESFEGWGFEDSDFWVRLLMKANIDKPREFFHLDTRNYSLQVNWRGWRALFRIYADIVGNKGICSYHIWHPIAEHRSDFIRAKNHKIFIQNTRNYADKKYSFTPLRKKQTQTDLFITKNPHSWNASLFGFFDNPLYIDENDIDILSLGVFLTEYDVRRVVFNNPYGNEKRLTIYNKLRSLGVDTYVVERGALPWSIYIDRNGFCAESSSYAEEHWNNANVPKEKISSTIDYIHNLRASGLSLEPQAEMLGGYNLKRKLFGDSDSIRILFIALQSPSDTTTNFFCGQVGSYANFINEISKIPYLLPSNWKVVYKNHPLTIDKFTHPDMTCVDDYHISDILECCDSVALINSGVGVLSIMYGKPVYNFGKAFYQFDGLSTPVHDANCLVDYLERNISFDKEKSLKFISYLINDFYSFASWTRAERQHTNLAKLSISLDIEYEKVMVDGKEYTPSFKGDKFNLISSSLFDRYRMDEYVNRGKSGAATKPNSDKRNVSMRSEPTKPIIIEKKTDVSNVRSSSTFLKKLKKLKREPYKFFYDALAKKTN